MERFRCIIAGGGTGGHIFPGIAVSRELEKRLGEVEILFVAGKGRMEADVLPRYGYRMASIDIEGLKGRGITKGLTVLFKIPQSFFQSVSIIRNFSPHLVMGVGGYSSGPMCLAARLLGIKTAIHEQNSYPGLTNRWLSRFVDQVFISFDESRKYLKSRSIRLTGNPVREDLFEVPQVSAKSARDAFTILVLGGSQGARSVNTAFTEALVYLNKHGRFPRVIHQTGKSDYHRVTEDYRRNGLKGEILPFIEDMAAVYANADIVVSRAGATTVFELAALGKPSVLVPYPYAANRHQEINARSLVQSGGAQMILESDLDPEKLANALEKYMEDKTLLETMGRRAKEMGKPKAAAEIAEELLSTFMLHEGECHELD